MRGIIVESIGSLLTELYRSNGLYSLGVLRQEDRSLNMVLKRGRDIFLVTCIEPAW